MYKKSSSDLPKVIFYFEGEKKKYRVVRAKPEPYAQKNKIVYVVQEKMINSFDEEYFTDIFTIKGELEDLGSDECFMLHSFAIQLLNHIEKLQIQNEN